MNNDIENRADSHRIGDWRVNSSLTTLPDETVSEVRIDSLKHRDGIKIRTERSEYTFLLTDPTSLRGLLTGGQIGEGIAEANMIAIVDGDDFRLMNDFSTIGKGMRISFYIPATEIGLMTSRITMISLTRNQ